jgi:hypothetical protein
VNRLGVGVDDGAHLDAPSSLTGLPATAVAGSELRTGAPPGWRGRERRRSPPAAYAGLERRRSPA